MPYFYANKVASDKLGGKMPVVEVLAYDYFDKTGFEVLVMKKALGQSLLDTIFDLPQEDVIVIFKQVLEVIKALLNIKFDNFGWLNLQTEAYPTYGDFINSELGKKTWSKSRNKTYLANRIFKKSNNIC